MHGRCVLDVRAKICDFLTDDFCCDDYRESACTAAGGGDDIGCVRSVACRRSPLMLLFQGQAEK